MGRVADMRDSLRAIPGMERLLPALEDLPPAYLVGGGVRDLLRGQPSADIDVAVEGDAPAAAQELAERLGGEARVHDRFGTATVTAGDLAVDLAATRRERYERPGALPVVEPAGLDEDLARRDFTVNAMALGLAGGDLGVLHDPLGGRADLDAGMVRVLHDRSFLDDPTRLLRAIRYEARLDGALEGHTEALARDAAGAGALDTVSGPRVRDELLDLLAEPEAPSAVGRMGDLGIATALHPALAPDPETVAGALLGAVETGARPVLAALAALCSRAPEDTSAFVGRLAMPAGDRDAVLRAAWRGPELAAELREDDRGSRLHALLRDEPPESLALALALGAPGGPVLRFVADLRGVSLEIAGADLVAAGVPESPAIGRALDETLRRKLDGELAGREDELRAALAHVEEQA